MRDMWIIFLKELKDTLRDRRTLFMMVLFPLLLFPLIIGISSKFAVSQAQKAQEKTLRLAVVDHGNGGAFRFLLGGNNKVSVNYDLAEADLTGMIQENQLDGAIVFSTDFDTSVATLASGDVKVYYKSTRDSRITKNRIIALVDQFEDQLLVSRFQKLSLQQSVVNAIRMQEVDVASGQERLGEQVGRLLPYLFIIFCFMGSMYPAIDLAAGEKERGTLETLLTLPVNRLHILLGKFGVVTASGVISALLSILGLYIGMRQAGALPETLVTMLTDIFQPQNIFLVLTLLIPLSAFFAALLLSLSIYTRSYKEAQSLISPLMIVVLIPGIIGMVPGVHLDSLTALIPILNVSLATRDIMSGTIQPILLAATYLSLLALAAIGLWGASKWFFKENILFRG